MRKYLVLDVVQQFMGHTVPGDSYDDSNVRRTRDVLAERVEFPLDLDRSLASVGIGEGTKVHPVISLDDTLGHLDRRQVDRVLILGKRMANRSISYNSSSKKQQSKHINQRLSSPAHRPIIVIIRSIPYHGRVAPETGRRPSPWSWGGRSDPPSGNNSWRRQ